MKCPNHRGKRVPKGTYLIGARRYCLSCFLRLSDPKYASPKMISVEGGVAWIESDRPVHRKERVVK